MKHAKKGGYLYFRRWWAFLASDVKLLCKFLKQIKQLILMPPKVVNTVVVRATMSSSMILLYLKIDNYNLKIW